MFAIQLSVYMFYSFKY